MKTGSGPGEGNKPSLPLSTQGLVAVKKTSILRFCDQDGFLPSGGGGGVAPLILLRASQLLRPSCGVLEHWPVPCHVPRSFVALVMDHTLCSFLIPHSKFLTLLPDSYSQPCLTSHMRLLAPSFFVIILAFLQP